MKENKELIKIFQEDTGTKVYSEMDLNDEDYMELENMDFYEREQGNHASPSFAKNVGADLLIIVWISPDDEFSREGGDSKYTLQLKNVVNDETMESYDYEEHEFDAMLGKAEELERENSPEGNGEEYE